MVKKKNKNLQLYELEKKSPGVAIFLSLLLCGAGSMYAGKAGKGFLILFGTIFLWFIMLGWIMWIVAPILAYNDVKKYNKGLILKYDLGE